MSVTKTSVLQQTSLGNRLTDFDAIRIALINSNAASSTYGITAAGTNQATATQLNSVYNQVDTVAANTGVNLPLSTGIRNSPFQYCAIINNGANSLLVYPSKNSLDVINGAANANLASGSATLYISAKGGFWFSLGSSSSGGGASVTPVSSSPYTASAIAGLTYYPVTNGTGSAFTFNLPASPASGQIAAIADASNIAGTHNINIIGNGNTISANGTTGTSISIASNGGSVNPLVWNGTIWTLFG